MSDAFQPALFNTPEYAGLQAHRFPAPPLRCAGSRFVFLATPRDAERFDSPGRAPHGGFDIAPDADEAEMTAIIHAVETGLRQAGARRLDIVQPPLCRNGRQAARLLALLCRHGYVVTRQELNQSLPVDSRPFLALGTYATRKRAAKARRIGVTTARLDPARHPDAYAVLVENRRKKSRELSMSWPEVAAMHATFPDRVHVFGAEWNGALIAAAICIAETSRHLYVYAWGERPGAEAASPVTLLAEHIHAFAGQEGFTRLDLGTSSVGGVVNDGLHAFKASLGATASLKLWLSKTLRETRG